jgi:hypothetical protein
MFVVSSLEKVKGTIRNVTRPLCLLILISSMASPTGPHSDACSQLIKGHKFDEDLSFTSLEHDGLREQMRAWLKSSKGIQDLDIAQRRQFTDWSVGLSSELKTCDHVLLQLKELELHAQNEHHKLAQLRDYVTCLRAPIRKLPSEILQHIFCLCVKSKGLPFHLWLAALYISHVCFRWREVALATSDLWRTILVHTGWLTETHASSEETITKAFLERSGGLPLSVYVSTVQWSTAESGHAPDKALAVAIEQVHRWEHLTLNTSGNPHEHTVLSGIGSFPNLREIQFIWPIQEDLVLFRDCPKLETVRLGNRMYEDFWPLPANFQHIQELHITSDHQTIMLDFIRTLPSPVTRFSLENESTWGPVFDVDDVDGPQVINSTVKELTTNAVARGPPTLKLFERLTMTGLSSLCMLGLSPFALILTVPQFLARSTPPLRKLTISLDSNQWLEWGLSPFISALPHVEHFEIFYRLRAIQIYDQNFQETDAGGSPVTMILRAMQVRGPLPEDPYDDPELPLPHLKEFCIDLAATTYQDGRALVDMIASRWRANPAGCFLQTLRLVVPRLVPATDSESEEDCNDQDDNQSAPAARESSEEYEQRERETVTDEKDDAEEQEQRVLTFAERAEIVVGEEPFVRLMEIKEEGLSIIYEERY